MHTTHGGREPAQGEVHSDSPPSFPGNGRRRTFVRQREAANASVPRPPRPADRTPGQTSIAWKPIWASVDVFRPSFGRSSASVLTCEGPTLTIAGPPGWCNSGTHAVSCCASIGQIFEYVIANAFKGNDMPFQLPVLLTWRGTDDSVFVFNLPPQMLLLILSRQSEDEDEAGCMMERLELEISCRLLLVVRLACFFWSSSVAVCCVLDCYVRYLCNVGSIFCFTKSFLYLST